MPICLVLSLSLTYPPSPSKHQKERIQYHSHLISNYSLQPPRKNTHYPWNHPRSPHDLLSPYQHHHQFSHEEMQCLQIPKPHYLQPTRRTLLKTLQTVNLPFLKLRLICPVPSNIPPHLDRKQKVQNLALLCITGCRSSSPTQH